MRSSNEAAALGRADFWDERYTKAEEDKPMYEWYRDFESLQPFFEQYLFAVQVPETHPRILHLGSGDSTIPYDLLKRGYQNQLCLDFSFVVVELMKARHTEKGVEWAVGDVRDMHDVSTATVDVAFDKGTLDAMIYGDSWSPPPDDVMENTGRYMKEVQRVLKPDGFFLYITCRQPYLIKPILNRNAEWDLTMETLGSGGSFEYFGFILRKHTPETNIAEPGI